VHVLAAVAGIAILLFVLWDGFETIVLPRRVTRKSQHIYYLTAWRVWSAIGRRMQPAKRREAYLSIFGPLSLLLLFGVWVFGLLVGFGLLYWSFSSVADFPSALYLSGNALFTLGSTRAHDAPGALISVIEAGLGMAFLALVISYLPVLYQSFSRREVAIVQLDARAGSPPVATELLRRHAQGGQALDLLEPFLREWERWAADLLESHISYPVLCYVRSQHDNQSWLGALTAMLDTCTLVIQGGGGAATWQAQLTFAMARHVVVDLAQILRASPHPPVPERLSPADFERLTKAVRRAGLQLDRGPEIAECITELRAMYEPFVNGLAEWLMLRLPGWFASGGIDNWRTSAWGRIASGTAVLPLADLGDSEHS
jgi:hypothetical protein